MSSVIKFEQEKPWSEDRFIKARKELIHRYGVAKSQATVRSEQELAKLFADTHWTQQQIADHESEIRKAAGGKGVSRVWVSYQLTFGRFLNWYTEQVDVTTVTNAKNLHISLTERKFRGFWKETGGKDEQRYRKVLELIGASTIDKTMAAHCKKLKDQMLDEYADGKWHKLDTIRRNLANHGEPDPIIDHVIEILTKKDNNKKYRIESKPSGKTKSFRWIEGGTKIDIVVLMKEAQPILDELKKEGRKSQVTIVPAEVEAAAIQIERLIRKLAK